MACEGRCQLILMSVLLLGGVPRGAVAGPAKPKSLEESLPAKLGPLMRELGAAGRETRGPPLGPHDAHGAYKLPDERYVNVYLMWATSVPGAKAGFWVHKPGETHESDADRLKYEGFDVDGFFVQRAMFLPRPGDIAPGESRSDARALLDDRVIVLVSIERPKHPNESVEWLRKLDLRGLTALPPPKDLVRGSELDDLAAAVGTVHKVGEPGVGGLMAAGSNTAWPPLRFVIERVSHGKGSKHVHARLVNDGKRPLKMILSSWDGFGTKPFSLMVHGATVIPIEVEHNDDGRLITRVVAPGKDYLVELGPDDQFREKKLQVRYKVDARARGACADCWTGETTTLTLTVPGAAR